MVEQNLDHEVQNLVRRHLSETLQAPPVPTWESVIESHRMKRTTVLSRIVAASAIGIAGIIAVAVLLYVDRSAPVGPATSPSRHPPATSTGSPPISAIPSASSTTQPLPSGTPVGSPGERTARERAGQTALADPMLRAFLAENAHSNAVVEDYEYPPGSIGTKPPLLLVRIWFDELQSEFPWDGCDIYRPDNRAAGAAWLIDIDGRQIVARSPIWPPDIRCF